MHHIRCCSGILTATFISNTFLKTFERVNTSDVSLLLAFNLKKCQPCFSSFGFLTKKINHIFLQVLKFSIELATPYLTC